MSSLGSNVSLSAMLISPIKSFSSSLFKVFDTPGSADTPDADTPGSACSVKVFYYVYCFFSYLVLLCFFSPCFISS